MTAKRIKIDELEKSSRARRGLLIIREVKTNPHRIKKVFITNPKDKFGLVTKNGIDSLKNSEITINDRHSVGSNITKSKIKDVFIFPELQTKKDLEEVQEEVEEIKKEELSLKEIDDRMMTIDDFLDDFEVLE